MTHRPVLPPPSRSLGLRRGDLLRLEGLSDPCLFAFPSTSLLRVEVGSGLCVVRVGGDCFGGVIVGASVSSSCDCGEVVSAFRKMCAV